MDLIGRDWTELAQDVTGSCEHGNELLSFTKVWEPLDQLSNYQFLEADSDVWSVESLFPVIYTDPFESNVYVLAGIHNRILCL
jgi:hypothetical protein